ncbi:MAG: linear amide C-N hydrolase [Clostridia bacterium]|nr:linear amide C-N hydrolase [Clostridia bacterium]
MCTSLSLPTPDGTRLFGRTLDLDTHFGEAVTFTPRRFPFTFGNCSPLTCHYALLGMATSVDGYPLYADAMNEKGLCMAGLRFAESAVYAEFSREDRLALAPWELIPYLLCTCATVEEVRAASGEICVVDKPFSDTVGTAPLHWHISDPLGEGLILEVTAEGMGLYPDKLGVLTNEPPYPAQMAAAEACLLSCGDEAGLPGGFSSPDRFLRTATLRRRWLDRGRIDATETETKSYAVAQFFSILGAVSPTVGSVMTPEGGCHRTLYTCCMDTAAGVYHYRTEGDVETRQVKLEECDRCGIKLLRF